MLFSLDAEYARAVGKVRANVVRGNNDVLRNVAHRAASVSTRLHKMGEPLLMEVKFDTGNAESIGLARSSVGATTDSKEPTVE